MVKDALNQEKHHMTTIRTAIAAAHTIQRPARRQAEAGRAAERG